MEGPLDPKVPQSATVNLATEIELMTGSHWTQEQRYLVAEVIRKYRFEQVGAVLLRVHALAMEKGSKELSELIYMGKF